MAYRVDVIGAQSDEVLASSTTRLFGETRQPTLAERLETALHLAERVLPTVEEAVCFVETELPV